MSLRNAAVRVDTSRRNSKLVAGPTSSSDGRLSSCSGVPGMTDARGSSLGASMSLHSVSRAYKKPVFALLRDLEQGLIVSPCEKVTSIPAPVSPYALQRALKQSDCLTDTL